MQRLVSVSVVGGFIEEAVSVSAAQLHLARSPERLCNPVTTRPPARGPSGEASAAPAGWMAFSLPVEQLRRADLRVQPHVGASSPIVLQPAKNSSNEKNTVLWHAAPWGPRLAAPLRGQRLAAPWAAAARACGAASVMTARLAFLGELEKWLPLSPNRFEVFAWHCDGEPCGGRSAGVATAAARLIGAPGETVYAFVLLAVRAGPSCPERFSTIGLSCTLRTGGAADW